MRIAIRSSVLDVAENFKRVFCIPSWRVLGHDRAQVALGFSCRDVDFSVELDDAKS